MDKKREIKKQWIPKKWWWIFPVLILLGLLVMNQFRVAELDISRHKLSIKTIKQGDFEDALLLSSKVEPKTSILINIVQGGAVAEIYAENGQKLKKGDPILRIHNPNAELGYLTQETAIIEQINNLRNIRISIKNQQLTIEEKLLRINNDFSNAKRQFNVDQVLYEKDVISKFEFDKSKQDYTYQKSRFNVIKESVKKEKSSRIRQLKSIEESISNMNKSLNLLRKNQENFTVKAPENGLLSSFKPVLGQNYNQGESIGKLDIMDGYILTTKVDEYYASKVYENAKGQINIDSKKYSIHISKIQPEIKGGQFEMTLSFENDSIFNHIKTGMNLKSKIFLSGNTKAILLPKGRFFNDTQGQWIFVLNKNGKAEKRNIKIGRENTFYYEVLEGLNPNEKVIISSYKDFKNIEKLVVSDK